MVQRLSQITRSPTRWGGGSDRARLWEHILGLIIPRQTGYLRADPRTYWSI
jgi:hypothetical protein